MFAEIHIANIYLDEVENIIRMPTLKKHLKLDLNCKSSAYPQTHSCLRVTKRWLMALCGAGQRARWLFAPVGSHPILSDDVINISDVCGKKSFGKDYQNWQWSRKIFFLVRKYSLGWQWFIFICVKNRNVSLLMLLWSLESSKNLTAVVPSGFPSSRCSRSTAANKQQMDAERKTHSMLTAGFIWSSPLDCISYKLREHADGGWFQKAWRKRKLCEWNGENADKEKISTEVKCF